MIPDQASDQPPLPMIMAGSWQAGVFLGAVTLILGLVVSFHPTGSLNVVAVLLGVLMIVSGLFHLIRVFALRDSNRIWPAITALLFIVLGVVLIRHLHLTRALIGLFIGLTWIVQGLTGLIQGIAGGAREGRILWIVFGAVSVVGGVVVVSAPASSLSVLAVLLGIWFVVMGIFEIISGLVLWRAVRSGRVAELTPV